MRALAQLFALAEKHIGVPNLLRPSEVLEFSNPRGILLYLVLWREKTKNGPVTPEMGHHVRKEVSHLYKTVRDSAANVAILLDELNEQSTNT